MKNGGRENFEHRAFRDEINFFRLFPLTREQTNVGRSAEPTRNTWTKLTQVLLKASGIPGAADQSETGSTAELI